MNEKKTYLENCHFGSAQADDVASTDTTETDCIYFHAVGNIVICKTVKKIK